MRWPLAFMGLAVEVAVGCGGAAAPVSVAPWIPPMPSCSCPEPTLALVAPAASQVLAASASAPESSAAPAASTAPASTERRILQGTVSGPAGRALVNAVVYLEDAPREAGRGDSAVIDQVSMSFAPFVTPIAIGGTIAFDNNDPFPHNVFTRDNGERLDTGMVSSHVRAKHTFNRAGVYRLVCNLHPNMLAYVVVSPSSYFARTNARGQFTIKDVPEGTYQVTTWSVGLARDTQAVKVAGGDATVDVTLHK
jgi:plastocyanin